MWLLQMMLPLLYVAIAALRVMVKRGITTAALHHRSFAKLLVRTLGWIPDRNSLRLSTTVEPFIGRGFFYLNMVRAGIHTKASRPTCCLDGSPGLANSHAVLLFWIVHVHLDAPVRKRWARRFLPPCRARTHLL
ncbi:hypothetical protein OAO87_02440 [bacterium]|nr:hypothetical protein [bacterium]